MGGNALKAYETSRLPADEYFRLVKMFETDFMFACGQKPVLIEAYKTKDSFGDADFLVESELLESDWTDSLKSFLGLTDEQFVSNGNVKSIGYHNFQIDLIVTPINDLEFAKFYFSFNDFGNLIGRIGHKLGVKIGHDGMSIILRDKSHIIEEVFLSKYPLDALELLGLDAARYFEGFETLEDMFKYVASSKFFDPEIYELEHRSNKARVRDQKRPTYNKFIRWVAETKPKSNHSFGCKSERGGYDIREPYFTNNVMPMFPWLGDVIGRIIYVHEFDVKFKLVYNGHLVSSLTGLEGKELGAFMASIKQYIPEMKYRFVQNPKLVSEFVLEKFDEQSRIC